MAKTDQFHTGVPKSMPTVGLLDGDIVAVRSAAIFDSQDGCEEDHLHMLIRKTVRDWVSGAGTDDYRVCMSLGRSFRYDAYPAYKSNRTQPRPRGTEEAREYLRNAYPICEYDTLEADDVMGIMATEPQDKEARVIISTDKDMLQIPAWQYNPDKDRWPHKPTREDCWKFLCYQWTCGDPGDGYPGIPGFGVAKFNKWWDKLSTERFWEPIGLKDIRDLFGDEDAMHSQEMCCRICQWEHRPDDWPY